VAFPHKRLIAQPLQDSNDAGKSEPPAVGRARHGTFI
jgi:hypothetical protein